MRRKIKKTWRLFVNAYFLMLMVGSAYAQDTLTLRRVFDLTLMNNKSIQSAKTQQSIVERNAERGASGFLPTIDMAAGYTYNLSNKSITEFANPQNENIEQSGAVTENYNASVNMSYTLYQGGGRKADYQSSQSDLNAQREMLRQQKETAALNAGLQFLEVVRLREQFGISRQSLNLSQDRFNRIKSGRKLGSLNELELLNAQVDLRADSAALLRARLNLDNAKVRLKNIMGVEQSQSFVITTRIQLEKSLNQERLYQAMVAGNHRLQSLKADEMATFFQMSSAKSRRLPALNLDAGYTFARSEQEANFVTLTQNYGWNAGVSLRYMIFDGNSVNRSIEIAQLQVSSIQIQQEEVTQQLRSDLSSAVNNYENQLELLPFFKRDVTVAKENYFRSKAAYQKGTIDGLQLREAQLRLLRAENEQLNTTISIKSSELRLKSLAGELIKE